MGKACLVTGKSGPLLAEIVRRAVERDRKILVTRSGQMDLGEIDEQTTSLITWNRRSALSARSVLLHAGNLYGRLDEAVVVFSPTVESTTFHESSIVGIEDRIDAEVKGYLYMLREIFARMVKQGAGTVALAVQAPSAELQSPLEAAAVGSFMSLSESLCRYYRNEPLTVLRFRTTSEDPTGFSGFLSDRLDSRWSARSSRRAALRWINYPPRFRLNRRSFQSFR